MKPPLSRARPSPLTAAQRPERRIARFPGTAIAHGTQHDPNRASIIQPGTAYGVHHAEGLQAKGRALALWFDF